MDELRKAFEDAYTESEKQGAIEEEETSDEPESGHVEESTPDSEPSEDTATDTTTDDTSVEKAIKDKEAPEKPAENKEAAAPIVEKAPASWSAKAREAWGKLPQEAQAEVMKREREVNKVLQETAGARNLATQLHGVLAPYKDGMMANGVSNPIEAIGSLLATESRLRAGNSQEKALTVANLIKSYGVNIQELDNILSNQGYSPQQQQQTGQGYDPRIEQMIEQRMAPVNQFLQMQQQQYKQQEQYQRQQAVQTVTGFAEKAEFINEVRMDMADLLDMAAARGQQMSIEDAYKKACAIHPEVSSVMAQRDKERALMGSQSEINRKKTAAASITGLQRGPSANKGHDSLRSTISSIWDDKQNAI